MIATADEPSKAEAEKSDHCDIIKYNDLKKEEKIWIALTEKN